MLLYIFVTVITISLAFFVKKTEYNKADFLILNSIRVRYITKEKAIATLCTIAIFMILFFLAFFRFEVGNDYGNYVVTCHEIVNNGYVVTEPGFNLIVKILYFLSGNEDYILMFGFFSAITIAIFIDILQKQSINFTMGFFVFMTMGLYFKSYNTIRYYLALSIAIFSLRYLTQINFQNTAKFIFCILFASTFHKSALIVLPLYLLAKIKWNKIIPILLSIIVIISNCFYNHILNLLLLLYPSYKGTIYIKTQQSLIDITLPILGYIFIIFLCFFCYKASIKDFNDNIMYLKMNILAIVLYLCFFRFPLINRITYYLTAGNIILLPNMIYRIEEYSKRQIVKIAVIAFCIVYFSYFLCGAHEVGIKILPYKSWLFHSHIFLNQSDLF